MAFLQHKKANHSNYLKDTLIPVGYLNVSSQTGNYIFFGLLLFRGTAFFASDSSGHLAFHSLPNPKEMTCNNYCFK